MRLLKLPIPHWNRKQSMWDCPLPPVMAGEAGKRSAIGKEWMDKIKETTGIVRYCWDFTPSSRTHVMVLHFNFIVCVYSIEEIVSTWLCQSIESKASEKGSGRGGAHMANKKLWQFKLNLYSPGSGLTQLKVRESNSTGWYVVSRQSPLGS